MIKWLEDGSLSNKLWFKVLDDILVRLSFILEHRRCKYAKQVTQESAINTKCIYNSLLANSLSIKYKGIG